LYGCKNVVLQIKGKVNAITIGWYIPGFDAHSTLVRSQHADNTSTFSLTYDSQLHKDLRPC
jgi:hypothetical protein